MKFITIKSHTEKGTPLEATFAPERGMNLVSYKKGELEIIDQSTKEMFETRSSGLGPLIGPHFFQRNAQTLPKIENPSLFPHIEATKAHGSHDPFTHGVGRYAPWQFEASENAIQAKLTGKDLWNEVPLSNLEGQNFTMHFNPTLTPEGLHIHFSVVSDTASAVGIHYYYHLPKGTGTVTSQVQNHYYDPNELKKIPDDWNYNGKQELTWNLENQIDYAFHPAPNPLQGEIRLDAKDYQLSTRYLAPSEESAWQLYHPKGASFVCIEPVSAHNPRNANLSVSSIDIKIEILE